MYVIMLIPDLILKLYVLYFFITVISLRTGKMGPDLKRAKDNDFFSYIFVVCRYLNLVKIQRKIYKFVTT